MKIKNFTPHESDFVREEIPAEGEKVAMVGDFEITVSRKGSGSYRFRTGSGSYISIRVVPE